MTHDFHYYITFMCARNAGFDEERSKKIALYADGVDGGDMKFVQTGGGKYKPVLHKKGAEMVQYYPLTVHHVMSSVNDVHSMGASIMSVPWLAFHFLPSLEVEPQTNPFYIKSIDRVLGKAKKGEGDQPRFSSFELNQSRHLESGLVCSKDSRFAKAMIKDTAQLAKKSGTNTSNPHDLAILGIRAHIIADLFAHEGFAGCRSMAANALNHANTLTKIGYSLEKGVVVSTMKTTGISRLGHGQAGQRPDEPYIKYSVQRKIDNVTFEKYNYDLFGAAVMTVTEVLKGNFQDVVKNYKNWQTVSADYLHKWEDVRDSMNAARPDRIKALSDFFKRKYPRTDLGVHTRSDYWAFDQMDGAHRMGFSLAADKHTKWFHETFFALAGVGIDEYMDVSVLWPWSHDDDVKARRINQQLLAGTEKVNVGKTSGDMIGYQIGSQYIQKSGDANLKPSTVYSKFTGIRVTG